MKRPLTELEFLLATAIAALLIVLLAVTGPDTQAPDCHTDTECMSLCPPLDGTCDGGPQP